MNRGSSTQNGLIDHVTLIFDLLTPKAYHFEYIPRSFPTPSVNSTLGLFVSELCCGQADKQMDRETDSAWIIMSFKLFSDVCGGQYGTDVLRQCVPRAKG